ncbi:MAG: glucose-1-phosphate adenylyltransferase subunit GlgD [Anaerovoracaceae bacterium]|jgi:glucose-1-phosphate adenylyltransferase
MSAAALIFADSFDVDLDTLTEKRTLAAVPFGARYRVIDFMISSLVNSGVKNIGIVTTQKYHSLMNHVRAGAAWDLDRKRSGVTFLPPYSTGSRHSVFENRLEAMQNNLTYLRQISDEYVIFTACNYVGNVDFHRMYEAHVQSRADITGLYTNKPVNKQAILPVTEYSIAEDGTVRDVRIETGHEPGMKIAANTYIVDRQLLLGELEASYRAGKKSFRRDVLMPLVNKGSVRGYEAQETLLFLDDTSCYLKSNLDLLRREIRDEIFHKEGSPIVTRVKDSAPTRYGAEAKAVNSLIADGAIIEGEVRNSIIFRGVRIKKGAVVENSVVLQDTTVGEYARLNYAVLDKNAFINDGRMLSGYITHPFYVGHHVII